ncbi:MAG: 3-oxoacyl-[acyl-carrier-protein] reductase [Candidatus Cloacimonetes bacterium]|nr:3-oxoacyl-[acyl-carrier-protein] reductase [Candidatus Cloacimonadota bacterium]
MNKLNDKVAIITGSARGIGFSIAEKLATNGATSVIIDLDQQAVDLAVQKIDDQGFRAIGFAANVTDQEQITSIFKEIYEEFDAVDILINNAGITKDGLIMKMKEDDWDSVINVNLKGTFICTQKICRFMMKKRSGVILNIASVIGLMGNAGQANYAASKGGIIAFTKSSAKEFASRNIRVNAIAPGFIQTEMTENLSQEVVDNYTAAIPLSRMGSADDVANLCLFLVSDDASYITGQTIQVDGGLIM